MIGKIVGTYKIESKLGEGGMGAVYKGVDTMLDREVAIKALRPELTSQDAIVERFRSEAVTLAKLHHPNIATLYSLFRQDDELYMVLEYVRGETLDEILQRRGALPAAEIIPVFCQILDGIDHAHKFGIIHRDIKPANMMLTEDGKLKVLDFGIARLLGSNRMTRAGNIIGTLEYMAPEQVKGQETDSRSDIYALGMMLYEILTGHLPFDTENEFELMRRQIEDLPMKPRVLNPSIPPEVETAIMRAIQKNPAHRFQTAGEFREFLLDAGFAAHSEMHRSTAPQYASVNSHSAPQYSNSTAGSVRLDTSGGIIKETRFGEGGNTSESSSYTQNQTTSSPSIFSSLNWIHYTIAGVAGVFFIGLLLTASILFFSFGGSEPGSKSLLNNPGKQESAIPADSIVKYRISPAADADKNDAGGYAFSFSVQVSKTGAIKFEGEDVGNISNPSSLVNALSITVQTFKEQQKSGAKLIANVVLESAPEVNYQQLAIMMTKIKEAGIETLFLKLGSKKIVVAANESAQKSAAQSKALEISISENGEYSINSQATNKNNLSDAISRQTQGLSGDVFLAVKAAQNATLGDINAVLENASSTGKGTN